MSLYPALKRQRQEDLFGFYASQGYIMRLCISSYLEFSFYFLPWCGRLNSDFQHVRQGTASWSYPLNPGSQFSDLKKNPTSMSIMYFIVIRRLPPPLCGSDTHLGRFREDDYKFKASHCYTAILRPAWAIWDPSSKNPKKKTSSWEAISQRPVP